ncbi:MoxR family ATPase [Gordonia sp. GW1C4-4]|uniref:MoxR family ATPase n=1 Tax=Gordonia tangerina TaxID=2911060 RepID=A0ABS9DMN3_9ACTN|nr:MULTISPECIES: MoxR family ATPase [Gordonia]MCF3940480.1 MoxR family ATPase [Gordonia tangerina]
MTSATSSTVAPITDLAAIRSRIAARVVGRERELDLILAAVAAGRDLILEGPPGTSKSTLLRAITSEWDVPFVLVEGNADLTPSRLVGHHNPSRVLREDYSPDNFVDGPLLQAMRVGGFLYVEEFNRAPEDTIDTLLTAMAERVITVPRVGAVDAHPTFRVVASMNPYDNVGTTRLSTSVHDRMCRLVVDYQDADAEREIVVRRADTASVRVCADAVAVTRATRKRDDIAQGSSVRGAIDLALVATQLCAMRRVEVPEDPSATPSRDLPTDYTGAFLDAMLVTLSGRIHLDDTAFTTAEGVLTEIWQDHFLLSPAAAEPG